MKNPVAKNDHRILVENEEDQQNPPSTKPTDHGSEDSPTSIELKEQDLYQLAQSLTVRTKSKKAFLLNKLKIQVV